MRVTWIVFRLVILFVPLLTSSRSMHVLQGVSMFSTKGATPSCIHRICTYSNISSFVNSHLISSFLPLSCLHARLGWSLNKIFLFLSCIWKYGLFFLLATFLYWCHAMIHSLSPFANLYSLRYILHS